MSVQIHLLLSHHDGQTIPVPFADKREEHHYGCNRQLEEKPTIENQDESHPLRSPATDIKYFIKKHLRKSLYYSDFHDSTLTNFCSTLSIIVFTNIFTCAMCSRESFH